jgi:acetyl-CoA C-acetyltransferase
VREAVIVATARTPIGKAYRGAFAETPALGRGHHERRGGMGAAGLFEVF